MYALLIAPFAEQDFMRRALAAVIALSFGAAPVGIFLMLRRMSLTGDAMSHAILPGVAAAFLLTGLNRPAMSLGGLIAGLVVATLSGLVNRATALREDASLAVFYLLSLALGVTLVSLNGTELELHDILFGNVRDLDTQGLLLIGVNTTLTLVVFAAIYRQLVVETVDPLFSRTAGRTGAIAHFAFLTLVVVNLVSAFHALGSLLAVGLMVLPATIARFWSADLTRMIGVAIASSSVAGFAGLLLSFHTPVPAGPAVVLCAGVVALASMLVGGNGGLLRRRLPQRHLRA